MNSETLKFPEYQTPENCLQFLLETIILQEMNTGRDYVDETQNERKSSKLYTPSTCKLDFMSRDSGIIRFYSYIDVNRYYESNSYLSRGYKENLKQFPIFIILR